MVHASEHHRDGHVEMAAVATEAVGDLRRKLAGRRQDQDAAALALGRAAIGRQPLQDRQGERGGLAGAGLGDAENVASGKNDGYGLGLNGGRRVIAGALQRPQDGRGEAEVGELRQLPDLSCGRAREAEPTSCRCSGPRCGQLLKTPRVSWAVGWNSSGRSTGGQIGQAGRSFALHAAGAPQIAHDCSWERGCFSHVEGHKSNSIGCSVCRARSQGRWASGFLPASGKRSLSATGDQTSACVVRANS